jgi:deazaflavin-dependent oxidoreductase (nitroreductase family)
MLLLTTTGRHSGKPRTVPLLYVPDGDEMIVIGSNWGGERNPDWYWNVLANPEAVTQTGRRKVRVIARAAPPEERPRVWSLVTAQYPGYEAYARRLQGIRGIPLVILTPVRK